MTKDQSLQSEGEQACGKPATSPLLSRTECNLMRGFAIIIIIIDNFAHLLRGVFLDNEYRYNIKAVNGFLNNLAHPDGLLPFNIISFYCPYGVMLFIFLSGYGLTLKYELGNGKGVSCKDFIFSHYNKMFTMHLKGLALFLTFYLIFNPTETLNAVSVFLQALLVVNLSPYHIVYPGVYWFFGMIMEMYVIFRLFIYQRKDTLVVALIVLSLIAMAFAGPAGDATLYLRMNFCIAILPFCMGVLAARHLNSQFLSVHKGVVCLGWFVLSFILLTLCKFNFFAWLLLPVFVIGTAVTIVKLISRVRLLDGAFGWLGGLSGVLFVVHVTVRQVVLGNEKLDGYNYSAVAYYLVITFGLCIMLRSVFSSKKE